MHQLESIENPSCARKIFGWSFNLVRLCAGEKETIIAIIINSLHIFEFNENRDGYKMSKFIFQW